MSAPRPSMLSLSAPAKVNLSLEVLGKRPDGFHEVRMLMASVSLADELSFAPASRLQLSCDLPGLDCGEGNLVLRAARALQKALGRSPGARLRLKKRIPLGGGLAGGSSDAAAALLGLRRLWKARLTDAALARLAASLGSDVPYCLRGGWALAEGRGEKLRRLALGRRLHLVLANPGFEVSTAWAYGSLRSLRPARRDRSRQSFRALRAGNWEALAAVSRNDLEPATAARHAEVGRLQTALLSRGALLARMSGSGPSVWGLFAGQAQAEAAARSLGGPAARFFAVHTLSSR